MAKASSKKSWYIFFSLAFILVIVMSLVASIKLTAMSQDIQSYAKGVKGGKIVPSKRQPLTPPPQEDILKQIQYPFNK